MAENGIKQLETENSTLNNEINRAKLQIEIHKNEIKGVDEKIEINNKQIYDIKMEFYFYAEENVEKACIEPNQLNKNLIS